MSGLNLLMRRDKRYKDARQAVSGRLHEKLKQLWRLCVQAFIEETLKHVHIDTGMSRASLYDTATKVRIGHIVLADAYQNRVSEPSLYYDHQQGVRKSIPLGQKLGKETGRILFGSPRMPILRFEFDIAVYQWAFHEDSWNSLKYGKEAFRICWLLNFANYIKGSEVARWIWE